jgi:2-amino-4-hydroxy-6-hydroxymethyldihydropteridine diphosphokinase
LSIGANLGIRELAVLSVQRIIEQTGLGVSVRMSSLYETDPVDCGPMAPFVNAVVEFAPLLCGEDLLKRLQAIEKTLGRSGGHNQPRELDIDIVTLGDDVFDTGALTVPHPRYRERGFVLVPLKELAPEFTCPATGRHIDDLLAALPTTGGVYKISSRRSIAGTGKS